MTELELLLPGATKPYVGTAGFRELTGPERRVAADPGPRELLPLLHPAPRGHLRDLPAHL